MSVYLTPQNIPSAIVLTLCNQDAIKMHCVLAYLFQSPCLKGLPFLLEEEQEQEQEEQEQEQEEEQQTTTTIRIIIDYLWLPNS